MLQLEGSIPPLGSNGGMSSAQYVNLSHNKLTGQLPASLNALSQVWTFSASNNSGLCGAISLPGNGDDIPPLGYSLGPCSSSQNSTATAAPEVPRKPSALAIAAFVICILLAVAAVGLLIGLLIRSRCRRTLLDADGNVQSRYACPAALALCALLQVAEPAFCDNKHARCLPGGKF